MRYDEQRILAMVAGRWGLLTSDERFDAKVQPEPTTGCYLWTANATAKGYGWIRIGGRRGRDVAAHRFAWERARGPIPDGLCVLHRCDTPRCVNADHLFLGTVADNNRDRDAKGRRYGLPDIRRAQTHCKRGHEFTPQNTRHVRGGKGRSCKACERLREGM